MVTVASPPKSINTMSGSAHGPESDQVGSVTRSPSDASRSLLGLLEISSRAASEMALGNTDLCLDGLVTKRVLRSLLGALHERDAATVRHSRRVAQLATGLAKYLGWEGRQLRMLEIASLLHDVAKIGVPNSVLYKPGPCCNEELDLIGLNYNIGIDVLQACQIDRTVLEIVSQSQRSYSHSGDNDDRALGQEVHVGARMLAIADAYESLYSDQIYRPGKPHPEIMQLLHEKSGTQFDGNLVASFGRYIDHSGLPFSVSQEPPRVERRTPTTNAEARDANTICHVFSYLYTIENLYDGFHLVDGNLKFLIWNRGAESLFGRTAKQMLGQAWSTFAVGYRDQEFREYPDHECALRQAINTSKPVMNNVMARRMDGQSVKVETLAMPLFNDQGALVGVAEFFRDTQRSEAKRPQELKELKLAAKRDALTNVANRAEMESRLNTMFSQRTLGKDDPFCVIFADADHFKKVNDTYGHLVGDQVLIDLAQLFTRETYSGELVARYGGEEFVILCPDTSLEDAVRRAERLRNALRISKIGGNDRLKVTSSFGVAQVEPGDSPASLLDRADKALFKAKESGRDRTCSLTNAELGESKRETTVQAPQIVDHWLVTDSFNAVVTAEMAIYKLGGFVSDHHAKLTEVSSERALMRIGRPGLIPFLQSRKNPPMEVELKINGLNDGRSGSAKVRMSVTIRPLGAKVYQSAFHNKAVALIRELRQYFPKD